MTTRRADGFEFDHGAQHFAARDARFAEQLLQWRQQGLVDTRRESQTIYCSLASGPADRVINLLHDIYCGKAECSA